MNFSIALICFPLIFVGELPDKTMFASLLLATKGRPLHVWLGAAAAFTIHVVIATTVGVALFHLLPHRVVEGLVAALFLVGAIFAWLEGLKDEEVLTEKETRGHGMFLASFIVIFVAEWGDLTQILTANLSARYHSPLSVGLGALLALWSVAGLAVVGGQSVMRLISVKVLRRVTTGALIAMAIYSGWSALG